MNRTSKKGKKPLIRKADRALQDYYRTLALNCEVCGGLSDIVHHIVEKSQCLGLRYEPLNLVPLCNSCHAKHHLAGDPNILGTVIKKRGQKWFDNLMKLKVDRKGFEVDFQKEYDKWIACNKR